ncbi:MAG: hypothetical protein ACJ739_13620 [Acidimicrobiales bacterium]
MRRSKALAMAASLCVLLGAAGCGGKGKQSEDEIVADVSATLQAGNKDLDDKEADCFAKVVIDEIGVEDARDIKVTEDEPSKEQKDAIAKATIRAQDECDLAAAG